MPVWSTDALPPADRFAYWREVRAKHLFGVSAELEADRRAGFRGIFSAEPLGAATLVEMHASPYSVRRTDEDISRAPGNSVCIYQQLGGAAWFGTGRRTEFTVPAGAVATSHTDLPYATRPTTEAGFHLRVLKIPFTICTPFVQRDGDLSPQPVDGERRQSTLLSASFPAFLGQARSMSDVEVNAAVMALAQVALAVRGLLPVSDDALRLAVRQLRLIQARDLIGQNFWRVDLTPARIAAMLGISVRQLHLLFEPTGTSVARHLTMLRLSHAKALLAEASVRPISAVAFASGFDSLATFYRVFRANFGMAPMEYRHAVVAAE
ncbi:helix-turn-helix transcriptional regulator [Bradyrhizobium sp. U87765 SZCCT0131]|uniref:helix-turn-helix transcriptional regulator n=1 Tax=unclassified Bradyrhizobium TaxID=2631580 RepID=UPI001BA83D33|nr:MULTISPECIES: helix-turn-helix transcriptional regulator [unclassified Bradyrhizobium]MBR1219940.1 helix-turn-helix transcriptional regulator [Bradyrhizobium sp. U87765 SZCCT0131]MBR1263604.1 helix-turn-helix transcriptional regulator [Bradyrhizobium sp. U87765 SZCCT0134]MBR1309173.1 helix-turn-helix transcriptional regulator [Bradyrhizobium sp. U87765 SZCCT0110]MBR1323936.1 helix-turn-helix transcriptional regulator [Bradyrhizobium sp. U87765 SZCCT0109]MBR1349488.1 helix-turn-helix transcr